MTPGTFGIIAPHPPIFVPEVGAERRLAASISLAALSNAGLALEAFQPQTVVLISPHAPLAADSFLVDVSDRIAGDLSQFGSARTYSWPGDPELACLIVDMLDAADISCASRDSSARLRPGWADHATIVPLSFLMPQPDVRVVVLSPSFLPYTQHRRLGEVVASAAERIGRKVAFVASGDLSHRLLPDAPAGYSVRGSELDDAVVSAVQHGTFQPLGELEPALVEDAGECGLRSIVALGGFLGEDPVPARILAYEGPWGVGYLTALAGEDGVDALRSIEPQTPSTGRKGGMPGADASDIVRLARGSIECALGLEDGTQPQLLDWDYPEQAGVFVSLHRRGHLRGCIGTIAPTSPSLSTEVAHNAVQAALHDPRFPALDRSELHDLDVKVDVLHAPQTCTITDLDPDRYGVIVSSGGRRGLLLPDLEGVDDVSTQISIAMQKAGIAEGTPCTLQRFRVDRYR